MTRIKTKIIPVLATLLILSALITVGAGGLPALCVEKTVDGNGDGVFSNEEPCCDGDEVTWKVVVTNCGDAPVYSIEVSDSNGHSFGDVFDLLNNGYYREFTYKETITAPKKNTAAAYGEDEFEDPVDSDPDDAFINISQIPCIKIEKRINGQDYVTAAPGDTLEITLLINNCGCVNLTNLSVHDVFPLKKFNAGLSYADNANPVQDGMASSINPEGWIHFTLDWWGNVPPFTQGHLAPFEPLQPGENFTITFEATVDELPGGALENCATVTANYTIPGAISGTVSDTDCATVFVPPPVPAFTPIGLIALVSLLSAIAILGIRLRKR
jgi:uncharacterized repeat protein (TIGR01451 family)